MSLPDVVYSVNHRLGEHAILLRETVDCMTAMVEFHNLLVYAHDGVDDMLVYGFAKKRLGDFSEFANAVRAYSEQRSLAGNA